MTMQDHGVSESWLSAGQVPFDNEMNWVAGTAEHCSGPLIFDSTYPGGCVEHADASSGHAAQKLADVVFSSRRVATGDGTWAPPAASQQFYTYASAVEAQSAFTYITQEIRNEDAQYDQSIDTTTNLPTVSTTTVTAQLTNAMALDHKLRDTLGRPTRLDGNPSAASDRHFYFAVKGDVLEVLVIWGGPSISDTSDDAAVLAKMISVL